MNYILFEDDRTNLLAPLSDLHASFEIRTGVFTNIERILMQISEGDSVQIYTRQEIANIVREKYPNLDVNPENYNPGIYLNGTGVWYSDEISLINSGRSYSNDNGLIGFTHSETVKYDQIEDIIKEQALVSSKIDVVSIKYIWDIFEVLSYTINKDNELIYNYKNGDIHPSCVLVNDDSVVISKGSKISAGSILDASNGPIIIDENATLDIGVLVKGPVYIGKNSIINPGAKIRGPVSIGPFCKVGGEVEDSIIQAFSNKQHDGFLGHSYIGEWVNLGANTNTSDLKNNYSNIRMKLNNDKEIETNKMFIGSIIGVQIGQKLGERIDSSGLRALLAILLLIVGIAIAYDTFFADQIINGTTNATSSDLNFFSQFIVDFSKEMPFFYGLFTIMFAIVLGVSAAFIRRFVSNLRKNLLVKS